ncbi:hypothetical protein ACFWY5_12180 [Nonomuraea sp. NPDC059007]|uniref:hypothetical protein n=1 Tax=Nonomuraea sp. NPDC059007 TaxID=3346692 RepID=UPI0036CCFDBB
MPLPSSSHHRTVPLSFDLVTGRPAALRAPGFRGKSRWHGWHTRGGAFDDRFYAPESVDILRRSYLLTYTTASFALAAEQLPLPAGPEDEIECTPWRSSSTP